MSRIRRLRDRALASWESVRAPVHAAAERRDTELGPPVFAEEPPVEVTVVERATIDDDVPKGIRVAAAWGWRLLIIGAVTYFILMIIAQLSAVIVPLIIALLLSALLSPAVTLLRRARLPGSLATAVVLICGIAAVAGVLTAVIREFIGGYPTLSKNAAGGIQKIQEWLKTGPIHMTDHQLNQILESVQKWLTGNQDMLTGTALDTVTTTAHALAGTLLVFFSSFFFLRDGRKIWTFIVRLFPPGARDALAPAGHASWRTLVAYVRATVLVAFIDAVGIGTAVAVLGVGFAVPLGALVFLGAFIPIIGATLTGVIAALVALVIKGPFTALLVLIAVIVVQQFEGHVLQPLLLGRAVALHPLAVIVAIGAGLVLAGIVGALVAVPLVAMLNTAIRHLAARRAAPPENIPIAEDV